MSNTFGCLLFLLWASHPAAAAGDELRVIAVHTAAAPRVSMVVQPPVMPSGSEEESCTVTIDGQPVASTVTPMGSGDLSVALVIDTASGLTSQELAAVQNGATEFLLRLPGGAHTMVVTAGGNPEVVAPLGGRRAETLSAISALRVGGSRATMPATMLAAESLESAPPGPHAIIVYTHGLDEQGMLPDRLSQAVVRSGAVLTVIRTGTDALWPSVVEQAGGVVVTTNAENIVQSFGDLAATLDDQYLVTFEAPSGLPAVAQVAFQTGEQEYTTVVNLPDAGPAQAAPTESSDRPPARGIPPLLVGLLVAGLAVTTLGVFLHRARRLRPAAPSAPEPSPSDDPVPIGPPGRPPTSPAESRPARKSLSAAIEGRRLARLILDSQPESRTAPAEQRDKANNNQTEDTPTDQQARYPAEGRRTGSGSQAGAEAKKGRRRENTAEGDPP